MEHSLILLASLARSRYYGIILEYLYDYYSDKISNIVYNDCSIARYEYRFRGSKDRKNVKSILPYECKFSFTNKIVLQVGIFVT